MAVSGIPTSNPHQCTLQATSKWAVGHAGIHSPVNGLHLRSISFTNKLSQVVLRPLVISPDTKLEAKVHQGELETGSEYRHSQGPPPPHPPPQPLSIKPNSSFHHREGSLRHNFLLPYNLQTLQQDSSLPLHSVPLPLCYQNHWVLLGQCKTAPAILRATDLGK